jgi:hypothetical protein
MHPEIKAFWDKIGFQAENAILSKGYPNDVFYIAGSQGLNCMGYGYYAYHGMRRIYDGENKLYWFHPTWSGDIGKWYPEKEMLSIVRLKAFI